MNETRPAAVAGLFYPADPAELGRRVDGLLEAAGPAPGQAPSALVAPHAGLPFSGALAARAFASVASVAARIRRVVVLGPSHRVPVAGMALPSANRFATPLGEVALDTEALERIAGYPEVHVFDAAHAREHGIEVELPFLQRLLPDFELVPVVVGDCPPAAVAEVIEALWGGPETLVVVSSDLSHFHPDAEARRMDAATAEAVERLDPAAIGFEQACGRVPLQGLLQVARRRGLRVERLGMATSADAGGPADRVVGYGAWRLGEAA